MSVLTISKVHAAQLEQLTGCRYATLVTLTGQVREQLQRSGRGRPFKHSMWVTVVLALMKLRLGVTVRTMEALTGIDSVTVARSVNRVTAALGHTNTIGARRYSTVRRPRAGHRREHSPPRLGT